MDDTKGIDELVQAAQAQAQRRRDAGITTQGVGRAIGPKPRHWNRKVAVRRAVAKASRNQQRQTARAIRKARAKSHARRAKK